jgi:hypothetical protein
VRSRWSDCRVGMVARIFVGGTDRKDSAPGFAHGPSFGLPWPSLASAAFDAPGANVGARAALARDSAPMLNSPTSRGTVDRPVTVPETEGRLLTASRLLSPHGTERERERRPARARRARLHARGALSAIAIPPHGALATRKPAGIQGRKNNGPGDRSQGPLLKGAGSRFRDPA